jgi:23S rRNA pseudouridine1911/1915/1917 synthase
VHLSSIGHPVLGDPLYGRKGKPGTIHDPFLKEGVKRMNRQALHAYKLGFIHPKTGKKLQFVSPMPKDIKEVLEWLRKSNEYL